jgi:hypothetical protein
MKNAIRIVVAAIVAAVRRVPTKNSESGEKSRFWDSPLWFCRHR